MTRPSVRPSFGLTQRVGRTSLETRAGSSHCCPGIAADAEGVGTAVAAFGVAGSYCTGLSVGRSPESSITRAAADAGLSALERAGCPSPDYLRCRLKKAITPWPAALARVFGLVVGPSIHRHRLVSIKKVGCRPILIAVGASMSYRRPCRRLPTFADARSATESCCSGLRLTRQKY